MRARLPLMPHPLPAALPAVVDPFGILERISIRINVSLVPFVGRWGLPFGGPTRAPVLLAFGEPIRCAKTADPSTETVDRHHQEMLESFTAAFDTHKAAYGWADKKLEIV